MANDRTQERTRTHARRSTERAVHVSPAIGEDLRRLTATELALHVKTKAAHWTVRGPLFRELHKMLDKVSDVCGEAVDLIAERAVQVGVLPPLTLAEVARISDVEDRDAGELENRVMLEALLADHETLVESFKATIRRCEDEHDYASVDLLSGILVDHEEQAWYIRKTLEGGKADAKM